MSRERDTMSGVSSRRSTCDRCRGQKLRCLRERADQKRCDRCTRAGSECITSPIFRTHNYSGGDQARKRQRHQHQQTPPQVQTPYIDQRTPMSIFAESHAAIPETSSHDWQFQTSPTGPDGRQDDAPVVAVSSNVPWEAEDSMSYDALLHEGVPQLFEPFGSVLNASENTTVSRASLLTPPAPVSQPDVSSTSSLPTTAPRLLNVDSGIGDGLEAGFDASNTTNATESGSRGDREPEEMPMQQLSKINSHLIALLDRVDKGSPEVTLDTLITPIDESKSSDPIVDGVLNRTREFLDLLKELSGPSQPPSPGDAFASSSSRTRASKPNPREQHSSYSSSPSDIDDSIAPSPTDSLVSSTSSPPPGSETRSNLKLDTASLLSILTTYIYVLRLHVVLFTHVYDYLKEISNSDEPYLCPIPGLSFRSFPIQSGNLQTIIFIQIVTSLFERMETLLGLPREFRLSSRRGEPRRGEPEGLLSHRDFTDIMKLAIRNEEPGRPEHGRGGIKVLRSRIMRTKQLLRDSIAP